MEFRIGNKIAQLRREKGLTQEQLAESLGVSAPAVSKWETDTSYPDITLLSPLARALGTNLDTLLSYEENLTQEQITAYAEQIVQQSREQGTQVAEAQLQKLLHRYPNSVALKFQAVALLSYLEMTAGQDGEGNFSSDGCSTKTERQNAETHNQGTMLGNLKRKINHDMAGDQKTEKGRCAESARQSETNVDRWNLQKKKLLQEVYASRDPEYLQPAIGALASLALGENDLETAEHWLKELPKQPEDATALWILLYEQKGQREEADKLLQNQLYKNLCQARGYMAMLIERAVKEDAGSAVPEGSGTQSDRVQGNSVQDSHPEVILEMCENYRKLDEIAFDNMGESDVVLAEVYCKLGREDEAAEYLKHYLRQELPGQLRPNPVLFPAITSQDAQQNIGTSPESWSKQHENGEAKADANEEAAAKTNAGANKEATAKTKADANKEAAAKADSDSRETTNMMRDMMLRAIVNDEVLGKLCQRPDVSECLSSLSF